MDSSMGWLFRRQYISGTRNTEVSFVNRFVSNFSSLSQDEYHIHGEMGMPLPPFVARFNPDLLGGSMLGVADEDGHVKLVDTNKTKDGSIIKEWSAHSNAVFDLAWINKESKMITASGDQTARLWDVEKAETVSIFRGHTCSLKSVAVQPNSTNVFLTGARDGNIMLWDTRTNMRNGYTTPTNTIRNAHVLLQKDNLNSSAKKRRSRRASTYSADSKQSVTSVVFQDSKTIISSGACDGTLKYWDVRKSYSTHKTEPIAFHVIPFPGKGPRKHGYSCLVLNSTVSRLFAVCTNDLIYEYATANLSTQPVASYHGHIASSFYVKAALSPDDRFLLCGSGDNNAYIWRTDMPTAHPWVLKGHFGEVTSVAWSQSNGEKIVTCSDDNTFRLWRLFQEQPEDDVTQNVGTCERKQKTNEKGTEEIIEAQPMKQKSCCKPVISNLKHRVGCSVLPVVLTKESLMSPLCRTPCESTHCLVESPSPKQTPRQKLFTPTSLNLMTPTSSSCIRKDPSTPKSSRSFMELWLKSPSVRIKSDPIVQTENELCETNFQVTNENISDFDGENLISHKATDAKQTTNDKTDDVKTTPKLKALKSSDKPRRKKRNASTPSENIKTLILSTKRKRESIEEGSENQTVKLAKRDKENKCANSNNNSSNVNSKNENKVIVVEKREYRKFKDLLDHAEETTRTS